MLISDFTIMCDDCGRKYRIPSDSLDVDYACSERPMGTEVQHIFYGVTLLLPSPQHSAILKQL